MRKIDVYITNLLTLVSYVCLLSLHYIITLSSINNVIALTNKFLYTMSDIMLFFSKLGIFVVFLLFILNLIGIPPMPIFFIKLWILQIILLKFNFYLFGLTCFINFLILFFYANFLNFLNIIFKSKKFFYFYLHIFFLESLWNMLFFICYSYFFIKLSAFMLISNCDYGTLKN